MRYHNYVFLTTDRTFHHTSSNVQKILKAELLNYLKTTNKKKVIELNSYTTLGMKGNTTILLWFQSNSPEYTQKILNDLLHTSVGKYLCITYTLFGIARPSHYTSSIDHNDTSRMDGKYLIIYPFSKTQKWYMLPFKTRQELMKGHIAIGKKFLQVSQLLLYSYGVDDNEFIVSYTTDDLPGFQQLVIELRSDKVRTYTLKDTPIFTCIYKTFEEIVNYL